MRTHFFVGYSEIIIIFALEYVCAHTFANCKMNNRKGIRISDIARLAGVSAGTVDRILHNRGRVSQEKQIKVEKVLKDVEYKPNLMARSLAMKKTFNIAAIIPSYCSGEYWEDIDRGIDRAATELDLYNVMVEKIFFDQYDKSSFDKAIDLLSGGEYQGVLVGTLFSDSVIRLSSELDTREIPYVYIDSNITGQNCLAYFGTNSYDGGYIAAKLLMEKIPEGADVLISRIVREHKNSSTQIRNREKGFIDYLVKHNYAGQIHYCDLRIDGCDYNTRVLDELFSLSGQNIKGAVLFNSACYVLADYLSRHKEKGIKLIGYDLLERNIEHLLNGNIITLIAQRPEIQGYNGIKALGKYLTTGERVPKINFMPIDILIPENIRYYNNQNI